MEYKLVYKDGTELLFDENGDKNAVRKAFQILNIVGRIRNAKFLVLAQAIYNQNRKVFPIP